MNNAMKKRLREKPVKSVCNNEDSFLRMAEAIVKSKGATVMTEATIKLTFDYVLTESNVEFNGRTYTKAEFTGLLKELDFTTRSESTVLKERKYGAEFVTILEDGQVLISAEMWCVENFIKMALIDKAEYVLIPFNKHFGYIIASRYVIMIDDDKTRHGIFLIKDLVDAGMPTSEEKIKILPNCGLSLSQNKYPHLTGSHVGMGFTKKEYKEFLEILKVTM